MVKPLLEHVTTKIANTLINEIQDDGMGRGQNTGEYLWGPGGRPVVDPPMKPDYPSDWSFWDAIGWGLQHVNPMVWAPYGPGTKPYVLPSDPDEKWIDHEHWVYHNGSWYLWRPGIGDHPGHWQKFTNTEDWLPPFDGPPPLPNDPGKGFSIEHPPGSGVWFEWEPDPNHPDGGAFDMPQYVNPELNIPGPHPESDNYDEKNPPGRSRY